MLLSYFFLDPLLKFDKNGFFHIFKAFSSKISVFKHTMMIFKIDLQVFETLHTAFYEIFGEKKSNIQSTLTSWSTFVNFKAFSRKSKLNPDYVMRYELSLKLSQENLHEMAPIFAPLPFTILQHAPQVEVCQAICLPVGGRTSPMNLT